jgi:hypothetical protein
MGQMEFVAQGEHLCQLADGLARAEGDTQREIRTISLKSTLRSLTSARGSSLASAVSAFASVALEALAAGELATHKAGFIARLREAGATLGTVTPSDEHAQVAQLAGITEAFRNLSAPAAPFDGPISRPMAPSAAVSITEEDASAPVAAVDATEPATVPPPSSDGEYDLAAAWSDYEDIRRRFGDLEPSIDDLISGEPLGEELISITELCFSGSAALNEAHIVRDRIRDELAEAEWNATLITDLVDELLDLVELGVGKN